MSEIHRIFTATLVIGKSGRGKTSLLKTFAEYLWESFHQVLLLYSWDGGAIPIELQKRMQQGLIRFWRARMRSAAGLELETLALATKGYWPKVIHPRTGETSPAVELVAPLTTTYVVTCPQGHELKRVPLAGMIGQSLLCSKCTNKTYSRSEILIDEQVKRTPGFEQVGGVAFDGLTSMGNLIMRFMDQQRGHGIIGGEKSAFGGNVVSGSSRFGGSNRADYGFAQTRIEEFVSNSLSIPHLSEGPVFTGLSTEGTDKGGLTVIGVDLPGSASLTVAPQWFGNICEVDQEKDENGKAHFVLYAKPFTDDEGRRHLLKTSASPGRMPAKFVDPPEDDGRPFEQFNLGLVFKTLDADLAASLAESVQDAPGVPAETVIYGEGSVPITSTGSTTTPAPAPASTPPAPPSVASPSRRAPAPAPRATSPVRPTSAPASSNGPQTATAAVMPTGPMTPRVGPPPPGKPPLALPKD